MRTQTYALLFLFVVNITAYVVTNAVAGDGSPFVPGVQYSQPLNATANVTQTERQFNATEMVEEWDTSPEIGIPLFGDIYFVTIEFAKKMRFLFDGFAVTIDWLGAFIYPEGGMNALNWIGLILRGIWVIMSGTLIFELISGRQLLP